MSKQKRKKPKKWYEDNINTLMSNMNDVASRLHALESTLGLYVEMRKDDKKLTKFIKKKIDEKENSGS